MPPPPLLQNHTWQTPGFRCLQKGRWGYPTPWQRLQKKIRRILGNQKESDFSGYACEDGFELLTGNVWGRGFKHMNGLNSQKYLSEKACSVLTKVIKHSIITILITCMLNILNHIFPRCADACLKESKCCSYEFSPTYLQCNLNKECRPTQKKFRDFLFCKKT